MVRDWFRKNHMDKLTPFIAAFGPNLGKSLEHHTEQAYEEMIKNWEKGQDAQGKAWVPNAPLTIQQKQGSTPLIDTRQMIESAGYEVDNDDMTAQIYIDDDTGKVLAHEYGVPDQGIPQRPILSPTAELIEQEADGIVGKAFDRSWARAQVSGTAVNIGVGGGRLGGN